MDGWSDLFHVRRAFDLVLNHRHVRHHARIHPNAVVIDFHRFPKRILLIGDRHADTAQMLQRSETDRRIW